MRNHDYRFFTILLSPSLFTHKEKAQGEARQIEKWVEIMKELLN